MNYQRIYKAFIADRRSREEITCLIQPYTERHHILPRSLGGGDEPSNLIRLTPEDHFFAHLLLAKIHGGEMWAPIAFMVGGSRKDYRPRHSRIRHGWAARQMAKEKSGPRAYQFDHQRYDLEHSDGRTASVLQSEMHTKLGLGRPLANLLVKGKISTAKGWSIAGRERKTLDGVRRHMYKAEIREFKHVNGDVFVGTQFQFSEVKGVSRPAVTNLVRGHHHVSKGWYLAEKGLPDSARSKAKWQKYLEN